MASWGLPGLFGGGGGGVVGCRGLASSAAAGPLLGCRRRGRAPARRLVGWVHGPCGMAGHRGPASHTLFRPAGLACLTWSVRAASAAPARGLADRAAGVLRVCEPGRVLCAGRGPEGEFAAAGRGGPAQRTSFPSLLLFWSWQACWPGGEWLAVSLQKGVQGGGSPLPGRADVRGGCGKRLAPVVWALRAAAAAHAVAVDPSFRAVAVKAPGGGAKLKERSRVTCFCNLSHREKPKSRFPRGGVIFTATGGGGGGAIVGRWLRCGRGLRDPLRSQALRSGTDFPG